MLFKWKVTYDNYGTISAIIINSDMFNLGSNINAKGVMDNQVLRIEKVLEADEVNIIDTTI